MTILDTNIVSEILRPAPAPPVVEWMQAQDSSNCFLTTITQAEALTGVARLPEGKRKLALENAIEQILSMFRGRIFSFDGEAAREYAKIAANRMRLGRPISQSDAMIAAISRSNDAVLATRNVRDFAHCGIALIDPWNPPKKKRTR